jgi:immunity protein 27 of polymorphic toxin system
MASPMVELAPDEVDVRGDWVVQKDRSVVADATEQRIEWLTTQKLERIANDWSGWETLYRDPRDGRLWELTYPQSEMHGGGPRRLHVLSRDEAAAKYEPAAI